MKYIKFTIIGDNLVYRNTGQYFNKKYTIKGYTVYGANGRKIGTVGKPTKTQEKRIESAKKGRERKLRKQLKTFGVKPEKGKLGYKELAEAGEVAPYGDVPLSRYQQELSNLSIQLRDCVEAGFMTEDVAQSYINRWMDCKNDSERSQVWKDVRQYFKDRGYQYP